MSFVFKKQVLGLLDLIRFKKLVPNRRERFKNGSDSPLPKTYKVNEAAKIIHPGFRKAVLTEIRDETADTKTFFFRTDKPFVFKAGQYATLGCKVGDSEVSRPYAIVGTASDALDGKLGFTVKKTGFFSGYLFDEAKVGDEFTVGDPSGEFYYEPVKDAEKVVAIAGGSGIAPFYTLACAIADGTEKLDLTILYGARTSKDFALKKELDALAAIGKIKVVYVTSDEKKAGFEHGFIGRDLITKYADGDFTVMMCGPDAMYAFLDKELAALNIPLRRIKKEPNCVGTRDVAEKEYKLTVHIGFDTYEVPAKSTETLLVAMERAGLKVPSKCRAGGCGFCHSRLVSGEYSIAGADKRRLADLKFGYIHPCCSYPDSDMELVVPKAK